MTRLRKYEGVDAWYPDLLSAWKTSAGTHSRIGVRSSIVPGKRVQRFLWPLLLLTIGTSIQLA
jgi:hypothetical protein